MSYSKKQIIYAIILTMIICMSCAQADILNVPDDFENIQAGIDAADNGDTVLVAPGVYEENITTAGKNTISIGSLTLTTGDPSFIEETIIDGGGNDVVVSIQDMQRNGYVLLRGFTIRNGVGNLAGGIDATGAIYADLVDLVVTDNQGNIAAGISAMSIWDAHFTNVKSIENEGNGVHISATRCSFNNCEFTNNAGMGGDIGAGSLLMNHCAFLNNSHTGLNIWVTRHISLDHLTIAGTRAQDGQNGNGLRIYQQSGSNFTAEINNSIIFGNDGSAIVLREGPDNSTGIISVGYSDIDGGVDAIEIEEGGEPEINWLDGNIDGDPLFIDPDNGDYHLAENSPCIDTGDPDSDPDPDGTQADMGAFHFIFPEDDDGVLHVPDEYQSIQQAIAFAVESNEVIVAPGVYEENINFMGKGISLIGNPDNPEEVVIDGGANNASVVVFRNDEGAETSMSGFTIRNGDTDYGGGIYCNETSPTLSNLIVTGNHASNLGGGIYCTSHSAPTISNSVIIENTAMRGGGFSCYNESRAIITNVIISNNSTWGDAGGVQCSSSDVIMRQCVVANNEANDAGGGLIAIGDDNQLTLESCTIIGNAANNGAGIYKNRGAVRIVNCILRDQIGEMFDGFTEDDTITFSNVEGGYEGEGNIDEDPLFIDSDNGNYHLTADSPCIDTGAPDFDPDPDGTQADMGAYYFHQRDIAVDPIEINFTTIAWEAWDSLAVNITNEGYTTLTINEVSGCECMSCIWMREEMCDPFTIEPDSSVQLWVIFHPSQGAVMSRTFWILSDDPDENEIVIEATGEASGVNEDSCYPSVFSLAPPFPNPFNSTTTIGYSLPVSGNVSLAVYDLSGREVTRLVNCAQSAGMHEAVWKADNVSSGVYVVRMDAGEFKDVQKMVLVR